MTGEFEPSRSDLIKLSVIGAVAGALGWPTVFGFSLTGELGGVAVGVGLVLAIVFAEKRWRISKKATDRLVWWKWTLRWSTAMSLALTIGTATSPDEWPWARIVFPPLGILLAVLTISYQRRHPPPPAWFMRNLR